MIKIGIGTAQFGMDYGINSLNGQVSVHEIRRIIDLAKSSGINVIDTATSYGNSEGILGSLGVSEFRVITKTRHFKNSKIYMSDIHLLEKDFYSSLKKLNLKNIDSILIHNANDFRKEGADKIFNCLQKLKSLGKIKKVGISVYDQAQLDSMTKYFDFDLIQIPFSIIDHRLLDSGFINMLHRKGVEIHARSIFLQGLLLIPKKRRPKKFFRWNSLWKIWDEWLYDNQLSPLEASLRYAISINEISTSIVGIDSANQLDEIILAASGSLPEIPDSLKISDPDLLNPSNWKTL